MPAGSQDGILYLQAAQLQQSARKRAKFAKQEDKGALPWGCIRMASSEGVWGAPAAAGVSHLPCPAATSSCWSPLTAPLPSLSLTGWIAAVLYLPLRALERLHAFVCLQVGAAFSDAWEMSNEMQVGLSRAAQGGDVCCGRVPVCDGGPVWLRLWCGRTIGRNPQTGQDGTPCVYPLHLLLSPVLDCCYLAGLTRLCRFLTCPTGRQLLCGRQPDGAGHAGGAAALWPSSRAEAEAEGAAAAGAAGQQRRCHASSAVVPSAHPARAVRVRGARGACML